MSSLPYKQSFQSDPEPAQAIGRHALSNRNGLRNETLERPADAGLTQRLECDPYKVEVGGSNPSARTINPSKIPDRWLQGRALHYERRGYDPRVAIVLSIGDWREEERLENEFNS